MTLPMRRWFIRAVADFLILVRFLTHRLAGAESRWTLGLEGRIARSGLLAQNVPVPRRWLDVANVEPVFIADPRTNRAKLIGIVASDPHNRSFRKVAYKARGHFLRRPPAICADVDSLKQAEGYGAAWFEVWDPQAKRLYRCPLAFFKAPGKFIEVDRGKNPQRGVLLSWFSVYRHLPTI